MMLERNKKGILTLTPEYKITDNWRYAEKLNDKALQIFAQETYQEVADNADEPRSE